MGNYRLTNYGPWTTLRAFITLLIVGSLLVISTYLRYSR
jgi:hypothetical protein